ncbi:MAG: sugar porter family MFS transporter [Verrucomicrobia bacterium]|nr:MAG: sugar porter family MFS transporter [Verrucomicrobiota bacterium]
MTPNITSAATGDDHDAKFNRGYIFAIALTAALGGLMFGYDWVVIGGAEFFYEKYFHLSGALQIGWAMSSALIGALVGTLFAGILSDRFGRKPLLLVSGLLFVVTSIGTGLAPSFLFFVVNRLLGGVAIGIASNLSPLYIAEIAPAGMRGRLVSVNQLTIAIGVMLAQIVNWLIAQPTPPGMAIAQIPLDCWNVQIAWRWMFGVTAVPAAIFFAAMFFVPESPRWLAKKGRSEKSLEVLEKIGGRAYAARSVRDIEATLVDEIDKVDLRELLTPKMLKILLLGVVLAVFQQWCGINIIFQYGSRIFADAGYAMSGILFSIVITGVVGVVMTFVAIATVDRWGRRGLMLSGAAGLTLIYLATGWAYHESMKGLVPVILVVAAIACYCCTLAPITWVILSEIFPNRIRGGAMSVSVMALWLGNFLLSQTFPVMYEKFGLANCFWVYAAICGAGFLFIWFKLPETKGKTLEQIERELVD